MPKLKKIALMISLVHDDVGKPTFKLEKAEVKEGICSWENPIYVSVKLVKEPQSGIVREKIYLFVVPTGSSKSGFLGKAITDLTQLRMQNCRDEADTENRLRCISEDSSNMFEEIRDELSCEKDLTSNLKLQRSQESNSNLILAFRDLNVMLQKKKNEIAFLNRLLEEAKKLDVDKGMDSGFNEIDTLKQQIEDLDWELDSYRKKNEEQEILLDELTREYECLKEENFKKVSLNLERQECSISEDEFSDSNDIIDEMKSQIEILEGKLKQQSLEYSECLIIVNELEIQVNKLKKELDDQARAFDEDIDTMMREKLNKRKEPSKQRKI